MPHFPLRFNQRTQNVTPPKKQKAPTLFSVGAFIMVRREGFEPPAFWFVEKGSDALFSLFLFYYRKFIYKINTFSTSMDTQP